MTFPPAKDPLNLLCIMGGHGDSGCGMTIVSHPARNCYPVSEEESQEARARVGMEIWSWIPIAAEPACPPATTRLPRGTLGSTIRSVLRRLLGQGLKLGWILQSPPLDSNTDMLRRSRYHILHEKTLHSISNPPPPPPLHPFIPSHLYRIYKPADQMRGLAKYRV